MRLDNLSDIELIDLYNLGEQDAFKIIFDRYWEELFRHARRMLDDEDRAKDVVQEIFIRLVKKGSINRNYDLPSVLHTAVKNAVISLYKSDMSRRKHLANMRASLSLQDKVERYNAEDIMFVRQVREIIMKEMNVLPAAQQESLLLRIEGELSVNEISKLTGRNNATVKTQIHDAKQKLIRAVFKHFPQSLHWLKKKQRNRNI
ncbi:RNA polymerase sigma factor [Chitinophaga varians]|uniref:RNA polymerase sigma factor n=1 Tax=Chitinophaga varians TaxID=2202339 RepID=UPI00165F8357|nr:sigma-70 family RNA polymerase sigma factor [Chitinophaga varians]MBC9909131.1 sigma-70 family RNA polymerase sigma factor [Chitinophaga varians]